MGVPMTRGLPITVHEEAYLGIKALAEKEQHGNISKLLRILIYNHLLSKGFLTPEQFMVMYDNS